MTFERPIVGVSQLGIGTLESISAPGDRFQFARLSAKLSPNCEFFRDWDIAYCISFQSSATSNFQIWWQKSQPATVPQNVPEPPCSLVLMVLAKRNNCGRPRRSRIKQLIVMYDFPIRYISQLFYDNNNNRIDHGKLYTIPRKYNRK